MLSDVESIAFGVGEHIFPSWKGMLFDFVIISYRNRMRML